MIKYLLHILIFTCILSLPLKAQFSESKERKKMWRKSARAKRHGKNREAFNPYLDKKGKNKPSSELSRQNAKEVKRMNKQAKKQKRRSMKKLGIRPTKVKKA